MQMARREFLKDFLIGGASFGALGAFGGNRFVPGAAGCKPGGKPRLRFGVLSDTHILRVGEGEDIARSGNILTLRRSFEWFRDQNVDAIVIAGDITDVGMVENLMAVSNAWYSVFPDDRRPDGQRVEKIFVTGNHDWYDRTRTSLKMFPDESERVKHVLKYDMAKWWEKAFNEPYAPIYSKSVKGYRFIGAHWDNGGWGAWAGKRAYAFGRIGDFLKENGRSMDPALPFFYVQHPHPKDTCYGPWAWGHDRGESTKALSAWQNAIAFSGHSHYSLTDARSIWQEAFTSVGTASLKYMCRTTESYGPTGYENSGATGNDSWKIDAAKMMRGNDLGDNRQGMLWSVYDDCIAIKRHEFLSGLDLGCDWVMPLPAAESRPFAFAEHAKKLRVPQFPSGSKAAVRMIKAKNRGGGSQGQKIAAVERDAFKISVPTPISDDRSLFCELEFTAETADGAKKSKTVLAEGFCYPPSHKKAKPEQCCIFAKDELGAGAVRFTVTPKNCFGVCGRPLVCAK